MSQKAFWSILQQGFDFTINSALLIFLTVFFTAEEVGIWILLTTAVFLITKLRDGFLQSAILSSASGRNAEEQTKVYALSLRLIFLFELTIGLLLISSAFLISTDWATYLFWLPIYSFSIGLYRVSQHFWHSKENFKTMFLNALANGLSLLAAMISVAWFEWPLETLLWTIPIFQFPVVLISLSRLQVWSWPFMTCGNISSAYKNLAINGIARELMGTLSSRAYVFLTAGWAGLAESAFVGIASRYANLIYLPNSAAQSVFFSKACQMAANNSRSLVIASYRRNLGWLLSVLVPLSVIIFALMAILIPILHGPEYTNSLPYLALLIAAGAVVAPLGHAFGGLTQALGRPELSTKVVGLNSVVSLLMAVVLTPFLGTWGAISAPIITDLVGVAVMAELLRSNYQQALFESPGRVVQRSYLLVSLLSRKVHINFQKS